jgi:hypothetical protein
MSAYPTRIYDKGQPCTPTSPPLYPVLSFQAATDLVLLGDGMFWLHRFQG